MEASASAGAGGSLRGSGQESEPDAVAESHSRSFKCVETSGK